MTSPTDQQSKSTQEFESSIISIVAHDLKTPIAAVRGFIDLVQQMGPLNEQQLRYLERALGGLQRMEHLIADLLDMARLDRDDLELNAVACDLEKLIGEGVEAVSSLAAQRGITITVDIHQRAKTVRADARWLTQVTNNLLTNAVKYNREGGRVMIRALKVADGVRVEVEDTGIGIAPDDQQRVFQPFVRARTGERIEGTGLGLSIAEAVIQRHGGTMHLTSTPGKGSTFSFTLPG